MSTAKKALFVQEYLVDLNATQAAIRAGYSEKTARSQGQRLLTNVDIVTAIAKAKKERADRLEISQDRVALELARVAYADIRKLFKETGEIKDPLELDENTVRAISSVKITKKEIYDQDNGVPLCVEHKYEYKFWDKNKALTELGKHTGVAERSIVEVRTHEELVMEIANQKRAELLARREDHSERPQDAI